jgi:hypothetical protein
LRISGKQNNKVIWRIAKKALGVLLLFGLLTTFFGCIKKSPTASYLLSDEMKSQNPFSGGEKLYFVTDSTDVIQCLFSGSERSNSVYEVSNGSDGGYHLVEVDKMWFSAGHDYSFSLNMEPINRDPLFQIHFSCNGKGMLANFELPLSKENTQTTDSIYMMDKWLYDVFVYEKEKVDNMAYKMYYSTELGVVKIDFSDGSFWELEKIEW